jgi:rhodanese-related sulfurtransferase
MMKMRGGRMLKVLIIKRRQLYIALAILIALIIGIILLVTLSKSSETFSQNLKYTYNKISPEQAKVLISKNDNLTVLDVRGEEEYLEGHIPQAILMPYKIVKDKYSSFDKQKVYLVYCYNGKKSESIAKAMANNGFSRVYVLAGGIEDWSYELVK